MTDPAERILQLLGRSGRTLAVAESLTGGLLTDAFVRIPGASAVLLGGVTAYDPTLKRELLGVDADLLAAEGAVHPEVARQMATGVRRALAVNGRRADAGVATTGVAGPGPDGLHPAGTVHVAAAVAGVVRTASARFDGDRVAVRSAAVDLALGILLAALDEERAEERAEERDEEWDEE